MCSFFSFWVRVLPVDRRTGANIPINKATGSYEKMWPGSSSPSWADWLTNCGLCFFFFLYAFEWITLLSWLTAPLDNAPLSAHCKYTHLSSPRAIEGIPTRSVMMQIKMSFRVHSLIDSDDVIVDTFDRIHCLCRTLVYKTAWAFFYLWVHSSVPHSLKMLAWEIRLQLKLYNNIYINNNSNNNRGLEINNFIVL